MTNGQLLVKYRLRNKQVDLTLDKAIDALLAMWQYERNNTGMDKLGGHWLKYKMKRLDNGRNNL